MQDPAAYFDRFQQRQQRADQFSEDIRKVMYGSGNSGTRTTSPGLKAGAALALSGYGAGSTVTVAEANAEARAACRKAVERARSTTCPFDDHRAFGASPADIAPRPRHTPPKAPEARTALEVAQQMGRHNRDQQQKIGAGAPWDAPETGAVPSHGSGASAYQQAAVMAGNSVASSYGEASAEALRFRKRMQQGSQDLIAGNYLQGDSAAARRRNQSLPPPGKMLLPEAQMKLQYDGGSLRSLNHDRAEYLNARVLAESNRERNGTALVLG
eukprot:TRINITY_DN36295_c0_g1_i1.p1 TRINITY_DN36295_c0_g1~~TRINITY_DN36295_c0_g1_i1.p1  ORF type:complete len:290 (-),score=60.87 TRINITY_DN36295_c0_g1_i1:54-863(-)